MSSLIPDYSVNEADTMDVREIILTAEEVRNKHPSEYTTALMRKNQNYASLIERNEFLLFNLPKNVTKEKIQEICQAKGVQILKTTITHSVDERSVAFAYVKVGSPSQVKTLKDKFRNFWIEDRKVKLKGQEELGYESFEHRTIVVQNLPNHYT